MWVYRIMRLTQTIWDSWAVYLEDNKIPNNWINENKFFVGGKKERLSEDVGLKVLASIDNIAKTSAAQFEELHCAPAKKVEDFNKRLVNAYGASAQGPRTERVIEYLLGGAGRVSVLAAMAKCSPLEGTGDDNPGVPVARRLWQELHGQKHAPKLDKCDANALASGQTSALASGSSANVPTAAPMISVDPDPCDETDPLQVVAEQRAERAFLEINQYNKSTLPMAHKAVVPGQPVTFIIDAPTSKPKVLNEFIAKAAKIADEIQKMNDNKAAITVRVLAGIRLDALAAAESQTIAMFPGFH